MVAVGWIAAHGARGDGGWKGKRVLSKGIQMPPAVLKVLSQQEPDSAARIAAVEEVRVLCSRAWQMGSCPRRAQSSVSSSARSAVDV